MLFTVRTCLTNILVKYLMRLCAYLGCARVQKFGSWLYFPLIQQEMTHEIDMILDHKNSHKGKHIF